MESFVTEPRQIARGIRVRSFAAAATLAVVVAACATVKPTGPLLLHPVPPTVDKYSLAQGALIFSGPDFSVSARPWDYRLVAEEFRRTGEPCPFGKDDTEVGRFLFFRVLLENRSARTLVFNPMRASLQRDGEAPLIPLENSDLFAFTGEDLAGAEARGRAFRRVSFDITVTVRPGQSLERYLVFRSPDEAFKPFVLELDDLWLDTKSFNVKFVFEAFKGK
jgi:hypothetical protein